MHLDGLECPRCGEKMTMIAVIKDLEVAAKILKAMGLPCEIPVAARPPPCTVIRDDEVDTDLWYGGPPLREPVNFIQDSTLNFPPYDDTEVA